MLACARIGAVHSVVFGGFAPKELAVADRGREAEGRSLAASCGIEPTRVVEYKPIVDAALALTEHQPDRVVVLQREQAPPTLGERDLDWRDAGARRAPAEPRAGRGDRPALHPLHLRVRPGSRRASSATTAGTRSRWPGRMATIYDIHAGDVWWTASDVGWVVGHSYIVYAPLLVGATTVLYEGKPVGTPDAGAFWRVIAEHGVQALFTAPTAMRAIKKVDPEARTARRARPSSVPDAVRGRRAARPGDVPLGERRAGRAGRRPLVADRDRLADRGQPARPGTDADQAGLADRRRARLRRCGSSTKAGEGCRPGEEGAIA